MARTIIEIKASMTDSFMANETMATKYGFVVGALFDETFSKVSWESIQFYIVSVAIFFLEKMFDTDKQDIENIISELKPHGKRWYINKTLAFMHGYTLVVDTDSYNTTLLTDAQITTAKVVKYAAVVEKGSVVYIKVAGANKSQLSIDQEAGLTAYLKEVKDAGVRVEIINRPAEHFKANLTVYFNPMVLNSDGSSVAGGYPIRTAIEAFISSLPFNGEYRNNTLIDILQAIDGVVMAELNSVETSADGVTFKPVDAYVVPDSGRFSIYNETDLVITYIAYETVSD
ncbi:MAG: hypothetical protein WCG93_12885 [Paludibacter sp.]